MRGKNKKILALSGENDRLFVWQFLCRKIGEEEVPEWKEKYPKR